MTQNPRGSISNAADAEKGHRKSSSGGNPLDGDNNKSIDEAIEPQHKESRFKPRDEGDQTTDRNRKDSIVDPGSENQGGPVNRISGSNAESMTREPIGEKKKGEISSMHVSIRKSHIDNSSKKFSSSVGSPRNQSRKKVI